MPLEDPGGLRPPIIASPNGFSGPATDQSFLTYEKVNVQKKNEGGKEVFDLTMHSTHFIYGYMASDIR